jgi:Fucosyltransferase, N-terminal
VVLFHMRETVSPQQLPDRNERPPGQKWIFAMKEPPVYSHFDASIFNGLFDWTMTYQSNSTILWPYGGIARRPKPRLLPDYFAKKFANSVTIAKYENSRNLKAILLKIHA